MGDGSQLKVQNLLVILVIVLIIVVTIFVLLGNWVYVAILIIIIILVWTSKLWDYWKKPKKKRKKSKKHSIETQFDFVPETQNSTQRGLSSAMHDGVCRRHDSSRVTRIPRYS